MKFLLFGLIFAFAFYSSSAATLGSYYDLQTDLLAKAAGLLTNSGSLIALLESQGKPLLAQGLKVIEAKVIEIENRVKNSHPTSTLGKLALEAEELLLKEAETLLEAEIKKLSASYYDLQTDLLAKAAGLLTNSGSLIALLESQGKPLLAQGLKVIEAKVIEIENRIKNSHPTSTLGKLALEAEELLLKEAETLLEAEIKKLSASYYDLQTDLLAKAAGLLTNSGSLIALLESQGKPLLAQGLKAIEAKIIEIETRVKNSHPTSTLGKLALEAEEWLLKEAETLLEAEIKKLSASYYDLQTDLLAKAAGLLTNSGSLIALLESQGKPLLAQGLKAIEAKVIEIETRVKNSHPTSTLGKLALEAEEWLLKEAETLLEAEIKKLSASYYDLQTDLLAKAAGLLTKSTPLIALLESQGKPLLAQGLKVVEAKVIEIETRVKNSHPSSTLGKLALEAEELLLKEAETLLEAEIKKLSAY